MKSRSQPGDSIHRELQAFEFHQPEARRLHIMRAACWRNASEQQCHLTGQLRLSSMKTFHLILNFKCISEHNSPLRAGADQVRRQTVTNRTGTILFVSDMKTLRKARAG